MGSVWAFIRKPSNQRLLAWLGGGRSDRSWRNIGSGNVDATPAKTLFTEAAAHRATLAERNMSHTTQPTVTAHAAEYAAIRAEVCAFHTVEGQVISITITFMGVLAALVGFGDYKRFIHFIPIPFVALGIIFGYTQVRIVQAASYLHAQLRNRVDAVLKADGVSKPDVWHWEAFRRSDECPFRVLSIWLNSARWLFFVAPALFPLTIWQRQFNDVGDVLLLGWDFALPILLICLAFWSSVSLPGRVVKRREVIS
jgi:hypothetical protein